MTTKHLAATGNKYGVTAVDPEFYDVGQCAICEKNKATHYIFTEWLCEECDPTGEPIAPVTTADWHSEKWWTDYMADYQQAADLQETYDDASGRW